MAPDTAAGWEPVKTDDAGNVWEWSYRDGKGTRIIVGPVERVYVEDLQRRIDRTVAYLRHLLDGPLDSRTAMVAEAAIEGLTRPTKGGNP